MKNNKEDIEKNLKLMAKTSIFVFIFLIISKFLTYIYKVVIARYFGPDVYGLYSIASMAAGLLVAFSSLGLSEGMLRFVALYRGRSQNEKISYMFRFSMRILIISGILAGLFLFFFADIIAVNIFHSINLIFYLKVFSISVPVAVISYAILSVVRAYEEINWYLFISSVARNLFEVISLIVLIFIGLKDRAVAFSYTLGFIGMLILSYRIYKYKISYTLKKDILSKKERREVFSELLKYSMPLIFSSFIFMLMGWTDSLAIGYFKSSIEVGFYNAALPIAMLLTFAPELFIKLFFPLINKEYSKNNLELIRELSKQVSKWIFLLNLPLFLVLIILPEASLNFIFGANYIPAANALRILAVGYFISSGIGSISLRLITMTGRSKVILVNTTIVAVLNILLNFLLVPMEKIGFIDNSSGLAGAALATLFSLAVMAIVLIYQSRYFLSIIPLRRSVLRLVIVSIIPTIILLYIKNSIHMNKIIFVLVSFFFLLLYLFLALIMKGFDRNDWIVINSVKNKLKSISK